jgi:exonuclease SbcC
VRIDSVIASAFGPFKERTLRLAPGMSVIWGHNESGKSSWHAALYAGLCGLRRARGSPPREDRRFAEKHHPWDDGAWEVSLGLTLDDGRRIEVRRDLKQGTGLAHDADLGRDVSEEVMNEGVPDAARWLGLDRRSFLAVACVRQAELRAVLDESAALQEHLQRAAATASTDATAAGAIARIEDFLSEHVGADRTNSTKPLRRAKEALDAARASLDRARTAHADFLRLAAHAEELAEHAGELHHRLRVFEAARAALEAETWRRRSERARELAGRLGDEPSPTSAADDALARQIAAVLAAWRERPDVPVLGGEGAAEIRAALEALPAAPEGDLEPDPLIAQARAAVERAAHALELHEASRPEEPRLPDVGGLSAEQLAELARVLEAPAADLGEVFGDRIQRARQEAARGQTVRLGAMFAGVLVAAAGIACVAVDRFAAGAALLVLGVAVLGWGAMRSGQRVRVRALEEIGLAESRLREERHARAIEEARAKGLPVDPRLLRKLAADLPDAERRWRDFNGWKERHTELTARFTAQVERLRELLAAHGAPQGGDVLQAFADYAAACAERARLAAEASRRPALEAQLAAREAAESVADAAYATRQRVAAELREVAARCDVEAEEPDEIVRGLVDWERRWVSEIESREERRRGWAELQALLDGRSLEDLTVEAKRQAAEATRLAAGLSPSELAAVEVDGDLAHRLENLRAAAAEAAGAAAEARGRVETEGRRLAGVPEAEEAVLGAEEELVRVLRLQETLKLARDSLTAAEERIHRDISRILADSIRPWLPRVTLGRYADIRVDPASLEVQVQEAAGAWRNASLLSHGTAEQVYLLLRMALARHLSRPEETCPLILDDITVQSDSRRKEGVLGLLHEISAERQVILFTQEEEVLAWAEQNLHEPRDRIERL